MDHQKIVWPRVVNAVFWTIVLHALPLGLYLTIMNCDVLHPLDWLKLVLSHVLNIGNWTYLIPLYALLSFLAVVITRSYCAPAPLCTSRFHILANIFSRNMFTKALIYVLLGIIMPILYLGLNGSSLTKTCSTDTCIDEGSFFIICSGLWTAIYYFLCYDLNDRKNVEFPVIQQLKYSQIRFNCTVLLKQAVKSSFMPTFYFLPVYYWNGNLICYFFQFLLRAEREPSSLTTFIGLFNFPLFAHAWLMSTIFFLTINTLKMIIKVHLTEHYCFALSEPSSIMLLPVAMSKEDIPLIQSLAYLDLLTISESRGFLRSQIFSLSQPGGHPHLWNALSEECFKLINNFICETDNIYKVSEPVKDPESIPKHIHLHVPLSPSCKLRNLLETQHLIKTPESRSWFDEVQTKINSYLTDLLNQPILNYCFGSLPDAKIKHLLLNSQPLVWASLSISCLAAKAIKEDQFGIILKDLPRIINTLLQLKFAIEKITKLGTVKKKFQKKEDHIFMRDVLKSAVNRSVYKIAIAYSDYINDLPLSPDMLQNMRSYVQFKEC